jgi:hypothetical protein
MHRFAGPRLQVALTFQMTQDGVEALGSFRMAAGNVVVSHPAISEYKNGHGFSPGQADVLES